MINKLKNWLLYRLIILALLIQFESYAQFKNAGQSIEKIIVKKWLKNKPIDNNLNNKFVVLELWATWCKPCLQAVPHMNDLVKKFDKPNDNIVFLSLSYEEEKKVSKILKKIDFKSSVGIDDLETFRALSISGSEKFKIEIPATFLINPGGQIAWKGHPKKLDEDLMVQFLSGELDPFEKEKLEKLEEQKKSKNEKSKFPTLSLKECFRLIDKANKSEGDFIYFEETEPGNTKVLNLSGNEGNKVNYAGFGVQIQDVFSEIYQVPKSSLKIAKKHSKRYFNVVLKAEGNLPLKNLEKAILEKLQLIVEVKESEGSQLIYFLE